MVISPHELSDAHIIIIPGSKSTIADLRWMKSRGLDTAIVDATNRGVTVVGICGGYQILGQQLDDPDATESPEPQSEPGLGLLPTKTVFDTQKTTRRVSIEIPEFESGPLTGPAASGHGYEIHTGITTGTETPLATLCDDTKFPSEAEASGEASRGSSPFSQGEKVRLRGNAPSTSASHNQGEVEQPAPPPSQSPTWPDGTTSETLPVIGSYVHGLFDSPGILRRLLNTTADTHNLPRPLIQNFSMEAEYDRLAAVVREAIDMDLLRSLDH